MKRSVQMKNAGIPKGGMRGGRFHGWRRDHWHDTRTLIGRDDNWWPVYRYTPAPPMVVKMAHRNRSSK